MLLTVHVLLLCAIAAALMLPRARKPVALVLAAVAAGCGALAVAGDGATRTLEVTHRFAAFVGNELKYKDFPIETTEAPGWAWATAAAGFAAIWAGIVWMLRPGEGCQPRRAHPFWLPLALGWSALALGLAFEKLAAPAGLVAPGPFERAMVPATIAGAFLLGARCGTILLSLAWLSLFVTLSRLPLVILGTLATRDAWGTSLDVHAIVHFANPLVQRTVTPEPASNEQLMWLIWAPHLLVMPALYMLSCSGVAIARVLWGRAGPPDRA